MNVECGTCQRCGGDLEQVALVGALQTLRCKRCGLETHSHLVFIEPDRSEAENARRVELIVQWHDMPPSPREIAALRRSFPDRADIPLRELLVRIAADRKFVIGTFFRSHAEDMIKRLSSSGLDLRIENRSSRPSRLLS